MQTVVLFSTNKSHHIDGGGGGIYINLYFKKTWERGALTHWSVNTIQTHVGFQNEINAPLFYSPAVSIYSFMLPNKAC